MAELNQANMWLGEIKNRNGNNMFRDIEKKYNVIYPENKNATYESLLNYSAEGGNPFQRWYRYKEGFSVQFIEKVVEEYMKRSGKTLLDPFSGSGTTVVAANRLGYTGIGFEVNPFSYFLSKVKIQGYDDSDKKNFSIQYKRIISELKNDELEEYSLPELSISGKVFQEEAEKYMMSCKTKINQLEKNKTWDLLLLGWLACIEELSDYRKAGNGLKKRKTVKPIIVGKNEVLTRIEQQYSIMETDLLSEVGTMQYDNSIFNSSSLNFSKKIGEESVDGIIFSPPYANCFDYTEIYKLELWFGDFVSSYEDLKLLRNRSLKSHLNIKYGAECVNSKKSIFLNSVLDKIRNVELWDKRIPKMIFGYFEDMFNIIDNCYSSLKKGGFCAIVVGNSAYGGEIVPTDLILSEYANSIGFKVDKIEVDRYIITSSQQYEKTKKNSKYLRESVICLVK